jgi:hypothetical protein
MVRLSIELGLDHDPTTQSIFDEPECQLCIRLWGIVLVHDRGTSLLLGRPLTISPNDTNILHPARPTCRHATVSPLTLPYCVAALSSINAIPRCRTAPAPAVHTSQLLA